MAEDALMEEFILNRPAAIAGICLFAQRRYQSDRLAVRIPWGIAK
jgi:hypothetical protein